MNPALDELLADLQHLQRGVRQARDFRDDDHIALSCPCDQVAKREGAPIGRAPGGSSMKIGSRGRLLVR
jgi:hypothetical protein